MNKETNCVTSYLADCETQLSQAPRQGLLYGVPVSLKECFSYKVRPVQSQPSVLPLCLHPALGALKDISGPESLGFCLASVGVVRVSPGCWRVLWQCWCLLFLRATTPHWA